MRFSWLNIVAFAVACIGALNWGAVGLFNTNIVRSIFRSSRAAERSVYSIVGLAGLFLLFNYLTHGYFDVPERDVYRP